MTTFGFEEEMLERIAKNVPHVFSNFLNPVCPGQRPGRLNGQPAANLEEIPGVRELDPNPAPKAKPGLRRLKLLRRLPPETLAYKIHRLSEVFSQF